MNLCLWVLILLFVQVFGRFDDFEEGNLNATLPDDDRLTFGNGEQHPILEPPHEEELDEEAVDSYCVDISSDCEEREHFCENQAFREVMIERCPRTCNLCKELITRRTIVTPATSDEDYYVPPSEPSPKPRPVITLPSTFAPPPLPPPPPPRMPPPASEEDPPQLSLAQLVGSAERHISDIEAMDKATTRPRTKKLRARKVCRDQAGDCNTKLRLCQNQYYSSIMERFCEKTCGFCSGGGGSGVGRQTFHKRKTGSDRTKAAKKTRLRGRIGSTTSTVCRDLGVDCIEKQTLCAHKAYNSVMQRMCPKTCNLCDNI